MGTPTVLCGIHRGSISAEVAGLRLTCPLLNTSSMDGPELGRASASPAESSRHAPPVVMGHQVAGASGARWCLLAASAFLGEAPLVNERAALPWAPKAQAMLPRFTRAQASPASYLFGVPGKPGKCGRAHGWLTYRQPHSFYHVV